MRLRLVLSGMLVCALVSLEAVAASAAPRRVYKGHTTQRNHVRLVARGNTVKLLYFRAKLLCRDGSILIADEKGFAPTRVRGNGRFHDVQVGSTDRVVLNGRMRGRRVRGTIRVTDRLGNGVRCKSRVKFTARHG